MLGCGHMSHYSIYALPSTLLIYSTLIAIILRDYNAAFQYYYSMMGLLSKYEPF